MLKSGVGIPTAATTAITVAVAGTTTTTTASWIVGSTVTLAAGIPTGASALSAP